MNFPRNSAKIRVQRGFSIKCKEVSYSSGIPNPDKPEEQNRHHEDTRSQRKHLKTFFVTLRLRGGFSCFLPALPKDAGTVWHQARVQESH
jgi:hypothetical protein